MFSEQCLLPRLQGYLIPFAPLAFIPYCQNCPRKMPSLLLVCPRLTHFTATSNILLTSSNLQLLQYSLLAPPLRNGISQRTCKASYGCFRPNKNGCDLDREYYRGGWHSSYPVLIRKTFYISQKLSIWKALQFKLSRLRVLQMIPGCCTPQGWEQCLRFPLRASPLRALTDLRLGGLLSRQQPNPPQPHPIARIFEINHSREYLLSSINLSFPRVSLTIGQISYVLLSSSPTYRQTCMPNCKPESRSPQQDQLDLTIS